VSNEINIFCALSSGFESFTLEAIDSALKTSLSESEAFNAKEILIEPFSQTSISHNENTKTLF
jgi:hypothetical protein